MQIIKGVVQQISVKEPREGQHGKFAAYGIKINDAWYNGLCNEDKQTGALTVKCKQHQEVRNGMEVQFIIEESTGKDGKVYVNINQKMFDILSSGSGAQQQPVEQQPTQQEKVVNTPSKTSRKDELVQDLCKGMAAAMALVKFEGKELPNDDMINRVAKSYFNQYKK